MDKQLSQHFAQIAADITALRAQLTATRAAVTSLAATHPDKAALAKNFSLVAENAIAHTLSNPYPEEVSDALRTEYEWLRKYLDRNAQGTDQAQ